MELIMPQAGYACAEGRLQLAPTIAAGTLGSVVGALPWYYDACWLGRARVDAAIERAGPWFGVERRDLMRADAWFARAGAWAVLAGRLAAFGGWALVLTHEAAAANPKFASSPFGLRSVTRSGFRTR